MDSDQFDRLIEVLTFIAGELETIARYIGEGPSAEAELDALKRIAEALERGK